MKEPLLFLMLVLISCTNGFAQHQISGTVTDAGDGLPIPGATVNVKGTPVAASTDSSGRYAISVPGNSILVFSTVGFSTQEVQVRMRPVINVTLAVARNSMREIIVTGYTSQIKQQLTGSVARVNGNEINLQPVASFDKALQGKVAGLLSLSSSGQPGSRAEITIRGKGSINGSNTPLFILDGVQINSQDFATINPSDIESYNVLKDASSTAIYGSRGANGVIVLTTKRGGAGKTRVDYNFQYGYSELPRNKLRLMNSAQKIDYEMNFDRPDGRNPFQWTQAEADSLAKIDNHILQALFHKGITQQHQLSASGGNEQTRFYLSGSIFDQQGVVRTTGLKRYTGRANIDNSFGNFKVGLNATLGYSRLVGTRENDTYIGSPLNAIRWFNPYITLTDANGNYQDDFIQSQPNPLRELFENSSSADQIKGVGSAFIEFRVPWIDGLKARTIWGADFTGSENRQFYNRTTQIGSQSTGGNGELREGYAKTFRYTATTSLSYQQNFGDHLVNASLFNEMIRSKSDGFEFSGYGLVGPFRNEAGITPGSPTNGYIPTVEGNATQNALLSYFVDAGYGFRKRYYLSAGARRDGSSRFGVNRKYANFGQVGASWVLSEERFLQSSRPWLNQLKFKVSYGSVGNQVGIGNFSARELLDPAVYNGSGGLLLTNLANPDLRWEKKLMFNTGLEFSMLKERLYGSVEYYNNITKDLFLDRQLSRTSGFSSINTNLGQLQNRGIEVTLNGELIRAGGFTWMLSLNYSYNRNKILKQPGQPENITGILINKEGEKANSLYLVRYAGVNPANGKALYYQKDGKITTDVYDPGERIIAGTVDPPYYGGVSNSFNYRGFSLEVLFTYAYGNLIYNNDLYNVLFPAYYISNLSAELLSEWKKPGDITNAPNAFGNFQANTTRFAEKGDHIRLRNITLGYELPKTLLQQFKINNLRFFAQGQNLYVWHNFQGYDPEVTTATLSGAQYPQLKTITFGLHLGL